MPRLPPVTSTDRDSLDLRGDATGHAAGTPTRASGPTLARCRRRPALGSRGACRPDHPLRRARGPRGRRPARPRARPATCVLLEVDAAGVNYADTHQTEDNYLARQTLPFVPGRRGRRPARPTGARVVALLGRRRLRRAGAGPPGHDLRAARRGRRRARRSPSCCRARRPGTCCAPAPTCAAARPSSCTPAAGGVGTPRRPARQGVGRRRGSSRPRRREDKRDLALELGADVAVVAATPTGSRDRLREANGGQPVDIVLEMTGGAVFDESLRALAPFGRLVDLRAGVARSRRPRSTAGRADGHVARRHRLLAGALLRPPGDAARRRWTSCWRRLARRDAAGGRRRRLPARATPAARTRTCSPGARTGKLVLDPTR